MSAMKARSANTNGSRMNATLAREMATTTAVNMMVPAAAKAGRQEMAQKKANTKATTVARNTRAMPVARNSTPAVQRATSGERGLVKNSTQVAPICATTKAIKMAFIARL